MTYSRYPLLSHKHYRSAFTLLELLAVILIIGILAGIVTSVATGTNDKALASKASAEMALIAKALDDYKLRNGDYPHINGNLRDQNTVIFEALFGRDPFARNGDIRIRHVTGTQSKTGKKSIQGGSYLEPSQFTLGRKNGDEFEVIPLEDLEKSLGPNLILDPWGVPYYYRYKISGSKTWANPGFILWSGGEYDESSEPTTNPNKIPASGIFDLEKFQSSPENLNDIIHEYSN